MSIDKEKAKREVKLPTINLPAASALVVAKMAQSALGRAWAANAKLAAPAATGK